MSSYENPWFWQGKPLESEDIADYFGMVYLIRNKVDLRLYIGKKFFWTDKKLPPLKGKTRRRIKRVETDWKKYWGSSNALQADIETLGIDNFERFVLRLCKTKSECAYYELKEQVDRGALLTEGYYNEYIGVKINGKNLRS